MSLLDAVDESVRSAFCAVGSTLEGLAGIGAALDRSGRPPEEWDTPVYDGLREFRAQYCDGDPGPENPPPPFTGGQCPTTYLVNLENIGAGGPPTGSVFATGPIRGVREDPVSPGVKSIVVLANPDVSFRSAAVDTESWKITTVSRTDGAPDTCGSPPPVFPPPSIPEINVDIEVGPSLTIPATIIFAPISISVDGRIQAPVTIELNGEIDFTINGTLEFAPNFDFSLDPSIYFPDGEDDPTSPPDNPGGTSEEPEEEPEEEPSDVVVGVVIASTIDSEARPSGISQEFGPDLYVPRLGSVRFGSPIGGAFFWSNDIDIKGLRTVIECPFPWGATRVVVNAAQGVALNWSAVKSAPPTWPPYLALDTPVTVDNR